MQAISNAVEVDQYDNNLLINGDFGIWQRTTYPNTLGAYTADRWAVRAPSSAGGTLSATIEANIFPAFNGSTNLRLDLAGLTSYSNLEQRIEDVRTAAGQYLTASIDCNFTVAARIQCVFIQYFGPTGSAAVNSVTSDFQTLTPGLQQRLSFTMQVPDISGKVIAGGGDYLSVFFFIEGLSTVAPPNGTYRFSNAKAEIGSVATPYKRRTRVYELTLCQRYCEIGNFGMDAYTTASSLFYYTHPFKVQKRTVSTMTFSSLNYVNSSSITTSGINPDGFRPTATCTATGPTAAIGVFLADAEL